MDYQQALAKYAAVIGVTIAEAKQDAERTIKQQMEREKASREFAEATWIEDVEDMDAEELDTIEAQAKKNGTAKISGKAVDAYGRKRTRVVKDDETKILAVETVAQALRAIADNVEVTNKQQKIDFWVAGQYFTFSLTKHRPPKNV